MLPPGIQSAIVSSMISAGHNAAAHAAVQASLANYRNAALLELADRLIGRLSDDLVRRLGLETSARDLTMSAAAHRHAIEERQIASKIDAELVASRISEAATNIQYQLLPQRVGHVFEVIGWVASAEKWLVLPLKLVRGRDASTPDRWWVRTCFPFGKKNYAKAHRKSLLKKLSPDAA